MDKSVLALLWVAVCITGSAVGNEADVVQNATRLNGGIVIVLDPTDATLLIDLAARPAIQVQALLQQHGAIDSLRQSIRQTGKYGQISVNHYNGSELPYVDNLVNMVVCDQGAKIPRQELMRVIAPHGTLHVRTGDGYHRVLKPVPEGMDEWNQFLHNAANNGVSQDDVGPPQRIRWHNTPETGRSKALMPSVTCMVTANGVLYTVEDRASPEDINAPLAYHLVARDAFNGIELWKRPINEWVKGGSTRGIKNVSSQLQRRLVAIGDHVYFPMEFDAPVSRIEGRSGKTVELLAGTSSTREVAVEQGVMYGVQGAGYGLILDEAALQQRRGMTPTPPRQVSLYAYDLKASKMLWVRPLKRGYIGASFCVNSDAIAYLAGKELIRLNKQTGTVQWAAPIEPTQSKPQNTRKNKKPNLALGEKPIPGENYNVHPTLILSGDKALCAFDKEIAAYSLDSGQKLWASSNEASYMKSPELFVIDNVMWNRQLKGFDLETGRVVKELEQKMLGPMSHDRCYRNRVTHQYYLNSASGGVDFVGLDGNSENPGPWVRSTCGLSAMPANGMVYNGPFVCQCAIGSMITGFNALYNETPDRFTVEHSPRLVKGFAYDRPLGQDAGVKDWPTYRRSSTRSGISNATLPANLATEWTVNVGPNPTAPVIVNGRVYVASRNTHTLHCLDGATGQTLWTFVAGGAIDSPPTYHQGLLLTGSRDGWVYCVDAVDGVLRWRFNALPTESLIADRGRIESAWPVNGSVLVEQGVAYFAAGRSSFLDGGVSVFGLDPGTGELIHSNVVDGPYARAEPTFPTTGERRFRLSGFRSGIFSVADGKLFLRHQAFTPELKPLGINEVTEPHLIPSAGYLDSVPQHRTYWTVDVDLCYGAPTAITGYGPLGDITAYETGEFFEVRGYSPGRNLPGRGADLTPFNTHSVFAGKMTKDPKGDTWVSRRGTTIPEVGIWQKNWSTATPFAGHAISVSANAVMVAGVPLTTGFSLQDTIDSFLGNKGGVLWMMDRGTGKRLREYVLPAAPAWDGIAIADRVCVVSLKDGSVMGMLAID
ncbi:MAG: outer membrane protein assembly factor BamB family protein [Planctomycetota bacterium]|jgi:outer membrane protein assembly factor BamB